MIINEHSKFRVCWDVCILILILASSIVIPFQLAFKNSIPLSYIWALHIVDLFFLIDIVLNFFTTFRSDGVEIRDVKETANHYLKTMFAFIVGNIASLLSNLDSAKSSFLKKIESVSQYLKSRNVPHDLITYLRRYYEYQWAHHKGGNENTLLNDLPMHFKLKIFRHVVRDLIDRVPLFRYCSPALRNELLAAPKPQTYAPDVHIAREGEIGKEIFFLSSGKAEITSKEGITQHGIVEDGDYFGDLSLLLNEKRTASVIALSYCEIFVLFREDFNRIKNEYSELTEVLKKSASEKTGKMSALVLDGVTL